jgi:D-3-phosphoglycerate dehydrogenase
MNTSDLTFKIITPLKPETIVPYLDYKSVRFEVLHKDSVSLVDSNIVKAYWTSINYPFTMSEMDKYPGVKYVISPTTGLTHIDTGEAARRNIKIISLNGEVDFLKKITATPEHAWGLILGVWRKSFVSNALKEFRPDKREIFMSEQLAGKNISLIGYGRIGKRLHTYASAFEMKVYIYDPYLEKSVIANLPENAFYLQSLTEIAEISDVVVVCASVVNQNYEHYPIINSDFVSKLKESAIVVNIARGILVDESALLEAVKCGNIRGIGLDVLQEEDLIDSTSVTREIFEAKDTGLNIVVTPHIAGMCSDALDQCMKLVAKKLVREILNV